MAGYNILKNNGTSLVQLKPLSDLGGFSALQCGKRRRLHRGCTNEMDASIMEEDR